MDREADIGKPRLCLLFLTSASLVACGGAGLTNNEIGQSVGARAEIVGYRDLRFGMDYRLALGVAGSEYLNPAALADCPREMPLRGCFLSSSHLRSAPWETRDGIPYDLSLSFNRLDRLTDIDLGYEKEGGVTATECEGLHARTLDWLTRDYGPFVAQRRVAQETGWSHREPRTPGGSTYRISVNQDGDFVTSPMRTRPAAEFNVELPIPQWGNDRYISLLSSFMVVDRRPYCSITVSFQEPRSVERRRPTN